MDPRSLGMLSKGLFSCARGLLGFLYLWGKAGLAHLQVD